MCTLFFPINQQGMLSTVPIQSIGRTLWPVTDTMKFWFCRTTEDGVTARKFRQNVAVPARGSIWQHLSTIIYWSQKWAIEEEILISSGKKTQFLDWPRDFIGGPCDLWPVRISLISDPLWRMTDKLIELEQYNTVVIGGSGAVSGTP